MPYYRRTGGRYYKKRYNNKRSRFNKSPKKKTYTRPKDTFDYARQAYKAAMQIKRLVNVEVKKFDYSETAITPTASWQIRNLAGISQGDLNANRNGDSVKPMSITFRLMITCATTTPYKGFYRLILLRGKHEQGDGTTEYLNAYEDGGAGIGDIIKFKLDDQMYNSTTLHDKVYTWSKPGTTTIVTTHFQEFCVKLDGHINYAGTATAPEDGGLYLLFVGSNVTDQSWDIHSRLTFTDN